ncbi:MAG: hypothetical protein JSR18_00780 [Proteobacteria bacterium]|nr:hypothetical protein [Pseudomonadota bacterium]
MNFLSVILGAFLVVALLTGKAHFRGTASRANDPYRYWTIVGCYVVLVLAGVVFAMMR